MPSAFSRTLRSLEADSFRRATWSMATAVVVLMAGLAWFLLGRIEVYEISTQARLEVEREVHPVAAPVAGRVAATHLTLGQHVAPGDVLVELESETERLQVEEEKAHLIALTNRHAALLVQISAEKNAQREAQKTASLAIAEARARQREAEAAAEFAESEAARAKRLRQENLVAEAEWQRAQSEAQKQRAAAAASLATVEKLESEAKSKERNHEVRVAELNGSVAQLEGEVGMVSAAVKRLEYQIEHRRIRAPVAGQLGEVAPLRVGAVLNEGDKIGAIVPMGELRAVAEFAPWSALGRIHRGQRARLRLEGFPWAQYGVVNATVASVASEPREGKVRVELMVRTNMTSLIPFQHGLPGAVEVQVERVSPATLVLRAAGKLLAKPRMDPPL